MRRVLLAGWIMIAVSAGVVFATEDVVMKAMVDEMTRSMESLQLEELESPYFIAYTVEESTVTGATARFGSLLSSNHDRDRRLTVEVRVGSYELDNSNFFAMQSFGAGLRPMGGPVSLPLEDDYHELRREIWLTTDATYKQALENLSLKRAALQNKNRTEDLADFSSAEAVTIQDQATPAEVDPKDAEGLVRALSAEFRDMPHVFTSDVSLVARVARTRFVNSEGSSFTRITRTVGLVAQASTQADDGLPLRDFVSAFGRSMDDLPSKKELSAAIREMGGRLARLREAPLLERYNGPVLFADQAAAELFAQVFAPGLLASRQPVSDNPRMMQSFGGGGNETLEDRIGARVLPRFLKAKDDPTLSEFNDVVLVGGYPVDDQGVPASATTLVERGVLRTLLADRTPISGVEHSTGNSRRRTVLPSNVIVSADGGMGADELKQELLLLVEERGGEFGMLVRRMGNPALKSQADRMASMVVFGPGGRSATEELIEAYKVFPDGREELVRNVEVSGIAPASFKEIVAASDQPIVYAARFSPRARGGMGFIISMGRAAGNTGPLVSWVVPSLLFEDLTLKKPTGDTPKPPVADHPFFGDEPSGR